MQPSSIAHSTICWHIVVIVFRYVVFQIITGTNPHRETLQSFRTYLNCISLFLIIQQEWCYMMNTHEFQTRLSLDCFFYLFSGLKEIDRHISCSQNASNHTKWWIKSREYCSLKHSTLHNGYLQLFVGGLKVNICYLCLFTYSVVQHVFTIWVTWQQLHTLCEHLISPRVYSSF